MRPGTYVPLSLPLDGVDYDHNAVTDYNHDSETGDVYGGDGDGHDNDDASDYDNNGAEDNYNSAGYGVADEVMVRPVNGETVNKIVISII